MKNHLVAFACFVVLCSPSESKSQTNLTNLYGDVGPNSLSKSEYHDQHYYLVGRQGVGDTLRATLTKVDLNGEVLWHVDFGRSTQISDVEFGSNNRIMISGNTTGPPTLKKSLLGRLTDNGNSVIVDWLRLYDLNSREGMGGLQLRSVGSDEYILHGFFVAGGASGDDVLLYTLDGAGEITSVSSYNGGDDQYWGGNIKDKDNSFTLINNMGGNNTGCYVTINNDLSVKEAYRYTGSLDFSDASIDTATGNKVVVGLTTNQTAFIADIELGGNIRWAFEFPEIDVFKFISEPVKNGFVLNYYVLGSATVNGIQRPIVINMVTDTTYYPPFVNWAKYLDDGESVYSFGHIETFDAGLGTKLLYADSRINTNGHGDFDGMVSVTDLDFDGCITMPITLTMQPHTLTRLPIFIGKTSLTIPSYTSETASATSISKIELCTPTSCAPNVLCELPGDTYISESCYGMILKSPNGSCFRITVDDSGQMISQVVTCP